MTNIASLEAPHIDFSRQFNLGRENLAAELGIREVLLKISQDVLANKIDNVGAIIVLGSFERHGGKVYGMVQMSTKDNQVLPYINVENNQSEVYEYIVKFSSAPHDGAIIFEKTGQLLGVGVYLNIEHIGIDVPDGCGTRHRAAASVSTREDVISVFTLSEENNVFRIWKNGVPVETI